MTNQTTEPDEYRPPALELGNNQIFALLTSEEDRINAAYRRKSQDSFWTFYNGLRVDLGGKSRVFHCVAAEFQRRLFEDVTPSMEAIRRGEMPPTRRFWVERTKKASKDADIAVIMLWQIAFPLRPFYAQIGACDKQQAGILKDRIERILYHNPWLNEFVEVIHNQIKSKKPIPGTKQPLAVCDIMAADIGGSHGGTPDLLIVNELTHITKWEFAQNLFDNADGVANGVVIVVTNAGFHGTPAEVMRVNALKSPAWKANILAGPAPWHSKEMLAENKARNPLSRYNRLWMGKWQSGVGDAVSEDKITRAFRADGPLLAPVPGWVYIAGLDLGVKHDHSALFVLGINYLEQRLRCAWWKRWKPVPGKSEVDLMDVEATVKRACQLFKTEAMLYDPSQAILMSQRLTNAGILCKEMTFVSGNQVAMASAYMQVMDSEIIELYDDEEGSLKRDLGKFVIVEKTHLQKAGSNKTGFGFKLEAVSDEYGHADVGTAMVITLPEAVERLGLGSVDMSGLEPVDDKPLSSEEIKEMPDELRELYEMEDRGGRGGRIDYNQSYGESLDSLE